MINNESCRQLITVEGSSLDGRESVLRMFAYSSVTHTWIREGQFQAVHGDKGLTADKREGDRRTPTGIFKIGTGFGTLPAPEQSKWPYRLTGPNDYWVDDSDSADYNQWICYNGDPHKRWKSFERLAIPAYAYAAVIEYNVNPIIAGKGSAIFLHLWQGPQSHTAGCIAIAEMNMKRLLQWLSPDHNPHIAIGARETIAQLAPFLPK